MICPNSAVHIPAVINIIPNILKKERVSVAPVESGITRLKRVVNMGSAIRIKAALTDVILFCAII